MRRFAPLRIGSPATRACLPTRRPHSTGDDHVHGEATTALQPPEAPQSREKDTPSLGTHVNEPDPKALRFEFDRTWTGVNPKDKTIRTAAGPLPISPLMDPSFQKARTRTKNRRKQSGNYRKSCRFAQRTHENIFARMLAEPIRQCAVTGARLPASFLQAFGLVAHPETNDTWWVPAAFEQHPQEDAATDDPPPAEPVPADAPADAPADTTVSSKPQESNEPEADEQPQPGKFFAPARVLSRHDLLHEFTLNNREYSKGPHRFAAIRSIGSKAARAIWRSDMHDVLRAHLRSAIVDALTHAAKAQDEGNGGDGMINLVKLGKVEDSLKYQNKVCFLLASGGEYRPLDSLEVPGVPGSAKAAYYLPELLGEEQLQRFFAEAPWLQDAGLILLKGQRNYKLGKRIWELEGFVADYEKLKGWKAGGKVGDGAGVIVEAAASPGA